MTVEELLAYGEEAGFMPCELELVEEELIRLAELIQMHTIKEILYAPQGYIIYTPCRLH